MNIIPTIILRLSLFQKCYEYFVRIIPDRYQETTPLLVQQSDGLEQSHSGNSPGKTAHDFVLLFVLLFVLFALTGLQGAHAGIDDHAFVDRSVQEGEILSRSVMESDPGDQFHLFSHVRPGELFIDGVWRNAGQISSWLHENNLLGGKTGLNIYGCEFAKGEQGMAAVAKLEQMLGITVAASDDITGVDDAYLIEQALNSLSDETVTVVATGVLQ